MTNTAAIVETDATAPGLLTAPSDISAVIMAQLDAFRKDDAKAAFAIASPEIQKRFGQAADRFLTMLKQNYPLHFRSDDVKIRNSQDQSRPSSLGTLGRSGVCGIVERP